MDVSLSPAVIAGVLVVLTFIYYYIKNRGVVPGPSGVPYLGLYPYLTDENLSLKLEEYKKQYGDIFSFTYTGRLYINLGSIKAMRELILNKSDCFMERYKDTNIMTEMLSNGAVFSNGEHWKALRKFFVFKFKEYGLSTVRDNSAGPIYDSLNKTTEDLKMLKGKSINIVQFLGQRSAGTMRKMLFGEKALSDENLQKIFLLFVEAFGASFGVKLLLIGPTARLLFALDPSFRKNFRAYKILYDLIYECVRDIENSMSEDNPTCLIEDFFAERNKRRRQNDPTWKFFSDKALVESVIQFVGDGIHTVAAFIAGIFNTLYEHPDDQEKMYAEILEVIGTNREPTAEDRPKLPYVNAFLNEYIRYTSILKFFPSLECTKETSVRGHRIPVGAILLYNFHSANHDPDTFDDPNTFNPSRYIGTADKPKAESPIIFGIGKRACSGEPFVMLQGFLFLTTIVKNFKIVGSNAPGQQSAEFLMTGKLELTILPRNEKV